ncbi:hypothetical protein [Terasakiella pusilla]|uniref:hypothetical protein n=1 Tax=Terasakiella pusilla TaxID=64973 RepID=UPI00048F2673|nr:hypothetical protein [Terasakiella pusilla]
MRLKDFSTTPYPNHTKSIEIEPATGMKVFTLFLRVCGTIQLPYKPTPAWLYLMDRPINEYGSDISIEPLGATEYLVTVDCYGIYPIIISGDENFQNALETAQTSRPVLWTDRGRHDFDELDIYVGSAQLTDFDAKRSMTLVRTAEFFENEEVMA